MPLPFAFPRELMVDAVPDKRTVWAEVVPGLRETYRFGPGQSDDYYRQYRRARFAFTWKKGGWDCLRHYEILASGCIPVFRDLDKCPEHTLSSFPKALVLEAMGTLLPWTDGKVDLYDGLARRLLEHAHRHVSCTALARRFLGHMGVRSQRPRVLVLPCHHRVSYSRETLLIGLKRVAECVEFPTIDYLYRDHPDHEVARLTGHGYGYARRIERSGESWSRRTIRESIRDRAWDLVVYGKMGLDERRPGSVPSSPLWHDVSSTYGPEEIAFVYGGDHLQDLTHPNDPYTAHLLAHSQFGRCFVRELARG